jgi:hypothetical protein
MDFSKYRDKNGMITDAEGYLAEILDEAIRKRHKLKKITYNRVVLVEMEKYYWKTKDYSYIVEKIKNIK